MAKTRVIIIAADPNPNARAINGKPRHLVKVENEVLLHRTAKQFLKYTDDVCIVGSSESYTADGCKSFIVKVHNTNWADAGKFMSSQHLWTRDGRTVLVFGDVWFSTDAVKSIMTDKDSLKFYLRPGASTVHSNERKEIFSLAFSDAHFVEIYQKLLHLVSSIDREKDAEWGLYRRIIGTTPAGLFANPLFTTIDDWTQDFDFPQDLEIWEQERKESRKKK